MKTEISHDVVIVGGGIVGTTAAYFLSRQGKSVALLEKGQIAGEQSSRNWGSVRVQGRHAEEVPIMLDSLNIWRSAETQLGESVDWRQNGQMLVAYDEPHLAQLEATVLEQRRFGIPSRILGPREIKQTLPYFEGTGCVGAMFNPEDGCAEPQKAAPAFGRAAVRAGVAMFTHCAALGIETRAGAVCGVQTERGLFKAETVVLASGAWTGRLLKPLGVKHPSLWIRGSAALTTPLDIEMRKAVVWGQTAYRQRLDNRVVIAVSEDGFHDLMLDSFIHGISFLPLAKKNRHLLRFSLGRPFFQSLGGEFSTFTRHRTLDPAADHKGLDKAKALFLEEYPDAGTIDYERTWAGYIDYMPDELPVIDQPTYPGGLIIAAGFSGNGFGLGPGVGKTISDLIITGKSTHDLSAFSSTRFQ